MDYIIKSVSGGFALIVETGTGRSVIAVPIRGIPGIFAFTQLFTFEDEDMALNVVAALVAEGAKASDYSDEEEGKADAIE